MLLPWLRHAAVPGGTEQVSPSAQPAFASTTARGPFGLRGLRTSAIGISSGASAPEILVDNFINNLKKQFTVVIEEVEIVKENITFKIPGKLN